MAGGKELRKSYVPFFKAAKEDPIYPKGQARILVDTIEKYTAFVKECLLGNIKDIAIDTETSDLSPEVGEIVGASFAYSKDRSFYIPVAHKIGKNLPIHLVHEFIAEVNKIVRYIFMFNARFDLRYLRYAGIEEYINIEELKVFDVATIVYNTDTNITMPSLKWACSHYLGWNMKTFSETLGEHPNYSYIHPKLCYEYACDDALGTYYIPFKMQNTWNESKFICEIDNKVNIPIMRMEDDPILIDLKRVEQLKDEVDQCLVDLETEIYQNIGYQFNINSSKQLANVLQSLGISTGVFTKTGQMSTKDELLEKLANVNPIVSKMNEYKKALKMNSSYLIPLEQGYVTELKGCRFAYFTTLVPTGRLAAGGDKGNSYFIKMNIQAITKGKGSYFKPIPSKSPDAILGYEFVPTDVQEGVVEGFTRKGNLRTAFVAPKGYLWVHIDYKTQELRLPANMSKEPVLLKVFLENEDFHEIMANRVFGVHNIETRKKIKPINFGALYGGTEWTFSRELNIPLPEAKGILDSWWKSLQVLKRWVDGIHRTARREGMVYTYFGRPRRLRHWYASRNRNLISFADRSAISHRVQGTGGDIIRYQMIQIYKLFREWIDSRDLIPKCTVHDEMNFYVRENQATEIILELKRLMEMKIKGWPVPMDVGIAVGRSWGGIFNFKVVEGKFIPGG